MSMEGGPRISRQETSTEYAPRKDEILAHIDRHCEGSTGEVQRELSDEKGIYLLEVWGPKQEGSRVMYAYQRAGTFGRLSSPTSRIYSLQFEGEMVVMSDDIIEYNPETKTWE